MAQKSAPVAGDAATLIDLLKKDYGSVNSTDLEDVLSADRSRVITIFKSYLDHTDAPLNMALTTSSLKDIANKIKVDTDRSLNVFFEEDTAFDFENLSENTFNAAVEKLNDARNDLNRLEKLVEGSSNSNGLAGRVADALTTFNQKKKEFEQQRAFKQTRELFVLLNGYSKISVALNGASAGTKLENPYLTEMIKRFLIKYSEVKNAQFDDYAEPNYQSSIQKSIPFLEGDLAFETIIDGLSRFLAKRIKEELTVFVIEQIQNELNAPNPESYLNELMVLLPRTADYLRGFDADQIMNFVDQMKQYIEDDFNHLLNNAANLRTTPRFKRLIANNPDFDFAFEALELIPQLSKMKNPIDYFDYLAHSRTVSRWSSLRLTATDSETERVRKNKKFKMANAIHFVSTLAHSLTYIDNGETKFVSTDFISDYGSEMEFYLLYIGFLHQQNIKYYGIDFNINDTGEVSFKTLMEQVSVEDIEQVRAYTKRVQSELSKISENGNKVYTTALSIKKLKDEDKKVDFKLVSEFVMTMVDMTDQLALSADVLVSSCLLPNNPSLQLHDRVTPYLNMAKKSNEIVLDLHEKNFSNAIVKGLELMSTLKNDQISVEKIMALSGHIQNSSNAVLLHRMLRFEQIPDKDEKKKEIVHLAFQLNNAISNCGESESCKTLKNLFQPFLDAITKSSNDDFKKARTALKLNLAKSANAQLIIQQLIGFDVTQSIIEPIKLLAVQNGLSESWTMDLIQKVEDYAIKLTTAAVIDGEFNLKKLNDIQAVKMAREEMVRYIQVSLPQLSTSLLRIKDDKLIKLIHFVNDIALSEKAEDVEAAINAIALPSGSASLKKERGHFVAINSFPGILAGIEKTTSVADAQSYADFAVGFTAPIGLSTKIKGNLGLFIPVIDIAAPVRFRFDGKNDTKALSEFTFENILAPGLYLTYRICNSPLTLNAGFQFAPELAEIVEREQPENDQSPIISSRFEESVRYGLGVTIDIPLVTLFARKR